MKQRLSLCAVNLRDYMERPYRPPMVMNASESASQRRDKNDAYHAANPHKRRESVRRLLAEMPRQIQAPAQTAKPGLIERLTGAARRFFQRRAA